MAVKELMQYHTANKSISAYKTSYNICFHCWGIKPKN